MGRIPKADPPSEDHGAPPSTVPYTRFFEANQRAKAAEEALAAMKAEVTGYRTETATAFESLKADTAKSVSALQSRHLEELALVEAGIDVAGRDALRAHWGRVPEADRGESPAAWWLTQVEATKAAAADPAKAAPDLPRALAAYLPAVTPAPAAPAAGAAHRTSVVLPSLDAVTSTAAPPARPRAVIGSVDAGVVTGTRPSLSERYAACKSPSDLARLNAELDATRRR